MVRAFFLDMIYLLLALVYVPAFLLNGRHRLGLRQRFGIYSQALTQQWESGTPVIWLHAVSVGEINAAAGLLQALRNTHRGCRFALSTITPTGNEQAQQLRAAADSVFYFPFDLSFVVRRVIRALRPRVIIIMETELWPNLLYEAARRHIPVVLVNGRISSRAYARYRLVIALLRPAMRCLSWCCMQSEVDRQRITALGADPLRVSVTGNVKFDQVAAEVGPLPALGIAPGERLIIAGSTHESEEEIIIGAFLKIRARVSDIRLLLAPRHPHRAGRVAAVVRARQVPVHLLSSSVAPAEGLQPILILDMMGVLRQAYRHAEIVIIGGSFVRHGGQNPIEAAVWAKPIVFGPHMFNFSGVSALFLQQDAAVQARDAADLERVLSGLLADRERCRAMGERASQVVESQRGSIAQVLQILTPVLGGAPKSML